MRLSEFDMDKPVVYARLNWGRWIADCPIHGEGVAESVRPGEGFICSRCHPGIYATMPIQIKGTMTNVPDLAMRQSARRQAESSGQVYEVVFPADKSRIEEVTRLRQLENANWIPGMTMDDLLRENAEHGV